MNLTVEENDGGSISIYFKGELLFTFYPPLCVTDVTIKEMPSKETESALVTRIVELKEENEKLKNRTENIKKMHQWERDCADAIERLRISRGTKSCFDLDFRDLADEFSMNLIESQKQKIKELEEKVKAGDHSIAELLKMNYKLSLNVAGYDSNGKTINK